MPSEDCTQLYQLWHNKHDLKAREQLIIMLSGKNFERVESAIEVVDRTTLYPVENNPYRLRTATAAKHRLQLKVIANLEQAENENVVYIEDLDSDTLEFGYNFEQEIYLKCLREELDKVLESFSLREKQLLWSYYDGNSLEKCGKMFGISIERTRQIIAKALRKLRHLSRTKRLKDFLDL